MPMEDTTPRDTKRPLGSDLPEMFRPPVNRAMRVLDRSFFKRTIPLSAATVLKATDISNVRNQLLKNKEALALPRLNIIREVKTDDLVRKCLLLREGIKHDGMSAGAWYWEGEVYHARVYG